MANVEIYIKDWCPFCQRAMSLLDKKGVIYKEIDVDGKPALQAEMAKKTGRSTVPQVFIDGKPIGGFDDMAALEARGQLDALLA